MSNLLQSMSLFVYQNHIDLHALSAFEALSQYLGAKKCIRLKRYKGWDIRALTELSDQEFIDHVTASSYYLLNPNKESSKRCLPVIQKEEYIAVYVSVVSSLLSKRHPLIDRLNQRCGVQIENLKETVVWECHVQAVSYQEAADYVEKSILSVNGKKGFLYNALFETFQISASVGES